jgi:hypothetical protein
VLAVPSGAYATIDEAVIADLKKFIFSVFSDVPNKRMEIGRLLGREAAEPTCNNAVLPLVRQGDDTMAIT